MTSLSFIPPPGEDFTEEKLIILLGKESTSVSTPSGEFTSILIGYSLVVGERERENQVDAVNWTDIGAEKRARIDGKTHASAFARQHTGASGNWSSQSVDTSTWSITDLKV
jgi:hypothetical protein